MLWLILDVIGAPSTGAGVVTRTTLQVAITRTVVAFAPDTLLVAVGAVTAAADHVTARSRSNTFFCFFVWVHRMEKGGGRKKKVHVSSPKYFF